MDKTASKQYNTFSEFYSYYLSEHQDRNCRRLHFIGSLAALTCLLVVLISGNLWFLLIGVIAAYGFAWTGHFFFEHNRPATFSNPLYSFMGDWVMFKDILTGKISL